MIYARRADLFVDGHSLALKPGFHMILPIRTIGTIEAICGFHIIASIVSKSYTERFGPGSTTSFWRESCKTKRKSPKGNKIICIMKYGFIRKFCCLLYHTLVQELRLHSLVFVVLFWNAFFGTQCRKSIEFWNNRCILGYVWIANRSSESCDSGFHIIACKFSLSPRSSG